MKFLLPILLFADVCTLFVVMHQCLGRYMLRYRLTERTVDLVLFGLIPMWRFRYSGIEDIRQISFNETWWYMPYTFTTLRAGNRLVGDIVAIHRKSGFPKYILISPDDAQDFVRRAREHLGK